MASVWLEEPYAYFNGYMDGLFGKSSSEVKVRLADDSIDQVLFFQTLSMARGALDNTVMAGDAAADSREARL